MHCVYCGNEIEDMDICPYCGEKNGIEGEAASSVPKSGDEGDEQSESDTVTENEEGEASSKDDKTPLEREPAPVEPELKKTTPAKRARRLIIINGIICAALLAFIGYTISTAVHWTKVDVPEHKETFHDEQRETGAYIVKMDDVSPCYVNQNWQECIDAFISEYNNACADRQLSTRLVGLHFGGESSSSGFDRKESLYNAKLHNPSGTRALTRAASLSDLLKGIGTSESSVSLCNRYADNIEQMQAEAQNLGPYGYVESLGDWGHLHVEKEFETVKVSNNDYRPAITHEATCYLGFIGECDYPDDKEEE